jgi:hypothetical protein
MTSLQQSLVGAWRFPMFKIKGATESYDRLAELLAEMAL